MQIYGDEYPLIRSSQGNWIHWLQTRLFHQLSQLFSQLSSGFHLRLFLLPDVNILAWSGRCQTWLSVLLGQSLPLCPFGCRRGHISLCCQQSLDWHLLLAYWNILLYVSNISLTFNQLYLWFADSFSIFIHLGHSADSSRLKRSFTSKW